MSTIQAADSLTALPDERALVESVVALNEHGSVWRSSATRIRRARQPRPNYRRFLRHDRHVSDAAGDRDRPPRIDDAAMRSRRGHVAESAQDRWLTDIGIGSVRWPLPRVQRSRQCSLTTLTSLSVRPAVSKEVS